MNKQRFVPKHFTIFGVWLLMLSCLFTGFGQSIPLTLIANDSRTGMQLSPNFSVKLTETSRVLPVVKTNNNQVVKVQGGDKISISVQIDGYYPDERVFQIDENFDSDGRNIVFELDPQPAASLTLQVKDRSNNKKLDATILFKVDNRVIKEVNSIAGSNLSGIVLTLPGLYSIEVLSSGYETFVLEQQIDVSDPPTKLNKEIKLNKAGQMVEISVSNQAGSPITNAKIRVTNERGDVLKNDLTTGKELTIDPRDSKNLTVEVEQAGYLNFKKTFDLKSNTIAVQLDKEPIIQIGVKDAESGDLLATNMEVRTPSGKVVTLKTTSSSSYAFIPQETGNYEFVTVQEGYSIAKSTLNISQLAGYVFEINLRIKNLRETYTISFVDNQKLPLKGVNFQLRDDQNTEVLVEKGSANEVSARLVTDNSYAFVAELKGYITGKGILPMGSGNRISVVLEKEIIPVKISTVDKFTSKPVASLMYLSDDESKIGQNSASTVHELALRAGQTVSPVFVAKGYKKYQAEPITNQTDATILLVAEQYPITFKIVDDQGNVVKPNIAVVINDETKTSQPIMPDKPTLLDVEAAYRVRINAPNFAEYDKPLSLTRSLTAQAGVQTIVLGKSEFRNQLIKIVDAETNKLVSDPKVVVQSVHGKPYEVALKENLWEVTVKSDEDFSVSVEAPGFELTALQFNGNVSDVQVVRLIKLKTNEQVFEAFDEILQRPVPAKFTLFDEENGKDLIAFDQGVRAKAPLIAGKLYTIRISAPDYRDKQEEFISEITSATPKRISFQRKFYPVTIKLVTQADRLLENPNLVLLVNSKPIDAKYLRDKKMYMTELDADATYQLKLEVVGFKPVEELLSVRDLVATSLIKTIKLEPVIVDQQVELPTSTPIENKVVTESIYEKNKENLQDLPENSEEIAKVLTNNDAIGKRYILTKVYFEQSLATMKPASDEQLNAIVQVLAANPKLRIELVGHTDNVGDKRQNQYLSQFRAKVVRSYLFNQGIDDTRITTKGFADEFPVEPNDSEENKAKNRRVELIVVEN